MLLTTNLVVAPLLAVNRSPEPLFLTMREACPPALGWIRTVPLPELDPRSIFPVPENILVVEVEVLEPILRVSAAVPVPRLIVLA